MGKQEDGPLRGPPLGCVVYSEDIAGKAENKDDHNDVGGS